MSIRVKLIIFIPAIIVLVNLAAFGVFQSGRKVQESYNVMLERVLLHSQIIAQTEVNLRALNLYLDDRTEASYQAYLKEKNALAAMAGSLSADHAFPKAALALRSYANMLDTFTAQEDATVRASRNTESLGYAALYGEAEKTAGYIQDQGMQIIELELGYYQPFYRQMFVQTERMNRWAFALIVADAVMAVLFALWLAGGITGPINRLVRTAKQVSEGNFAVKRPALRSRRDELGILSEAFARMLDDLIERMAREKDMLEKDRLVKELELKALQNQINPHFLFNTLNVLSKLALLEGAERTSDLTVTVSNLLRYNLRELDRLVPLRDEVGQVKAYIAIQQARFRDRVRFEMAVDESCLQAQVPPLTLQPLVENAFAHGIEAMETGAAIGLAIRREGSDVLIEVSDNGAGMDEATRLSLLRPDEDAPQRGERGQSTGIGTRNVFRRLALLYGRDDLVGVRSAPGAGTTITIRIPDEERGDGHVSAVDRR